MQITLAYEYDTSSISTPEHVSPVGGKNTRQVGLFQVLLFPLQHNNTPNFNTCELKKKLVHVIALIIKNYYLIIATIFSYFFLIIIKFCESGTHLGSSYNAALCADRPCLL